MAGAQFRPHPEKKDTTIADVVMMADLKGMLPRFLVNQVGRGGGGGLGLWCQSVSFKCFRWWAE